ncbi:MAG TPA: Bax inhibitor-1/YccA family protein [Candidatus Corynebacterium gallistercoris]|uniref:Bax inhibitor-1/YccA family protein n=1 Tax=Candidatus Corynebacterium gallistercoris TaxID=2838530 RepID=A0A9D1RYL6_9CORY|nr:Bax inhibitor-1/YccA family protein [Candidatus Corynebacterium gallistercoris]
MGSLAKNEGQHPFAQGNQGYAGGQQGYGQNPYATSARGGVATAAAHHGMQDAANYGPAGEADRPMTVDDVVTKTGITLAVIVALAAVNYFVSVSNPGLGMMLTFVGMIGGLVTVLISAFGKKYGSAPITLTYAAFEGLFVGGFSFLLTNMTVGGANAGAMIAQAVLATIGVFAGMLFVYKSGAIRVTPKFTRAMIAALIGVLVLSLGSLVIGLFTDGAGPLRDGGPIAILFSLVCIGLAAMSFLLDFDQADKLVRAGAPSKMAWGVALGLAVTLVWLYTEILRLLSYFQGD